METKQKLSFLPTPLVNTLTVLWAPYLLIVRQILKKRVPLNCVGR